MTIEGGLPVGAAVLHAIVAAEVRGYQRAIAALRTAAETAREEAEFWDKKTRDGLAAPEELHLELHRRRLMALADKATAQRSDAAADYLESLTTEGTKP